MNPLHTYLHSFQEWKKILFSFIIDAATVLLLFLLLSTFGRIMKSKVDIIMQGRTVEQVQQLLLSSSLENADLITNNILSFAYTFIGGFIIVAVLSLLIYSFSRAYLWNYLSHQKFNWRRNWRWNWLTLVLLAFLTIYSLLYLLIQFILNIFLATANTTVASVITQLVSFFILLLFWWYGFNVSYYFVKTNQVWKSIGDAFQSLTSSSYFIFMLLSLGTAVVVGLISFYIKQATFRFYWAEIIISTSILLLFISWFRIYAVVTFHDGKKHEAVIEKEP